MTREELSAAFRDIHASPSALDETRIRMQNEIERERKTHGSGFWLMVSPSAGGTTKLNESRKIIEPLLRDALLTQNRPTGWNFTSPYNELNPMQGGLQFGKPDSYTHTKFYDSGGMLFFVPIEQLQRDLPKVIFPLALLEYPTSFLRLARVFYRDVFPVDPDKYMLCTLILSGIKGWELRAQSPKSPFYSLPSSSVHTHEDADDLMLDPVVFSSSELQQNPDA